MSIATKIKEKWEKQGVKFSNRPFAWIKTLRTAYCAFCGRQETEGTIDQGFSGWAILTQVTDRQGKAPEICPECLKGLGKKLSAKPLRTVRCVVCGEAQREKIFGVGFPGWCPLPSLTIIGNRLRPIVCPNCSLLLARKLGDKFTRGTWTDLVYPADSLLTSTKMTQNQANFTALAEQHAGAPEISVPVFKNIDFAHIDQFFKEGTGTLSVSEGQFQVINTAGQTVYGGLLHKAFGGKGLSFDEKHEFIARINFEVKTGHYFYWTMGEIKGPSGKSFGFKVDATAATGYSADGVSDVEPPLWTYGATGWVKEVFKAILYPAEKVEFYRNGSLVGITETCIPSGVYPELGIRAYCMLLCNSGATSEPSFVDSWIVKKAEYTEEAP